MSQTGSVKYDPNRNSILNGFPYSDITTDGPKQKSKFMEYSNTIFTGFSILSEQSKWLPKRRLRRQQSPSTRGSPLSWSLVSTSWATGRLWRLSDRERPSWSSSPTTPLHSGKNFAMVLYWSISLLSSHSWIISVTFNELVYLALFKKTYRTEIFFTAQGFLKTVETLSVGLGLTFCRHCLG